jgi:hypothetical protein
MSPVRRAPASVGARLSRAFAALAEGLTYTSESDYPYRSFNAVLQAPDFTSESFRNAVRIGRRFTIDMEPADEFFRYNQDPTNGAPEAISAYALLEQVMTSTLTDIRRIRVRGVNVVKVRVYIVGRLADGSLAGLRSVSIET